MAKKETVHIDNRVAVLNKKTILNLENFSEFYTKEAIDELVVGSIAGVTSVNTRAGAVVITKADIELENVLNVDLTPAVGVNTAKVGITTGQATDIATNNAKVSYTGAAAVAVNTAKVGITSGQAADIVTNNAKVNFTGQAALDLNTAKVGISTAQASEITANNSKISYTDASAVTLNTAKVGITSTQASNIVTNNSKVSYTDSAAVILNTAKISFPEAPTSTASFVRNNGAWVKVNDAFTVLVDAANISWDAAGNSGNLNVTITLGGSRVLDNPTNMEDGASYNLIVKQDATGSRTLTYGSVFKWAGGTVPTLSTAANAIDIFTFIYDGTNLYGSIVQNFS
tara:strand:+ start:7633 stop:8658 length:1026 start_codon:yes stop_codon:yes gene_type:complete